MVSTVIAKPTKHCNADCSFCCAPIDGIRGWSFEEYAQVFAGVAPALSETPQWIHHGGEPMTLGPDLYHRLAEFAWSMVPGVEFSMQTNLLAYKSAVWRDLFTEVFNGRISTSFDVGPSERTLRGSSERYARRFWDAIERALADGIKPMVIATFSEDNIGYAQDLYDLSYSYGQDAFPIRLNYRYPAGRASGEGELVSPETYGEMLLGLYERWLSECPPFDVTPLDQMLRITVGLEASEQCPWTHKCGGKFLGIEPSGDVYNCSEFADLSDPAYRYGNIFRDDVYSLLASRGARRVKQRRVRLPQSCVECRHYKQCGGGCMRDAILFDHGLGGKFHYCASWKMVFDRIKESVRTGEADRLLQRYHMTGAEARARLGTDQKHRIIPVHAVAMGAA